MNERFMQSHYGPNGFVDRNQISEERPFYRKVEEGKGGATKTYLISCDEGWRESIVCCGMYEWAADWLISVIQSRPYAKDNRPGRDALQKETKG